MLQTITAVYLRLSGAGNNQRLFCAGCKRSPLIRKSWRDAYALGVNVSLCPPRPAEKTYRVRGTKEPFHTFNIIDGIMSVKEVAAVAAKYNATYN